MLFPSQCIRHGCLFVLVVAIWLGGAVETLPEIRSANQNRPTDETTVWPALRPFHEKATWQAPVLTDGNIGKWLTFIRPTKKELKWKQIRWHKSLSVAAAEARRLQRPVLLWTMNGHPCGET